MLHNLLMCQNMRRIDLSTPVQRFTGSSYQSYYTFPIMKLSNGWFVQGILETIGTYHIRFYVSKNNCLTWTELCYIEIASDISVYYQFNTVSRGTKVYCIFQGGATYDIHVEFVKFDATTVSDINIFSTKVTLHSGNRSSGMSSIAISPSGVLTATWSVYTSAQFYDAFTVKSTDDGTTWTKHNGTAGMDKISTTSVTAMAMESVVKYRGESPIIAMITRNPMGAYNQEIRLFRYATSWTEQTIYSNQSANYNYIQQAYIYVQTRGANAGRIWVFFNYASYMFQSYSDDGGATYTAVYQMPYNYPTSPRSFAYYYQMAENSKGELWILYTGQYQPSSQWYYGIFRNKYANGAWGIEALAVPTSNGSSPQIAICNDVDFEEPLFSYWNYSYPTGDFVRGIFYV